MFMDINLTGEVFSDYVLTDVGVGAYQLQHDWFTKEDLQIATGAGGGGTVLTEGVDYQLVEPAPEETGIKSLHARVTDAMGTSRTVYHKVQIINATYQSGDLYHSGKYIADSNAAEDADYRGIKVVDGANYVVLDNDRYGRILVTTGAADRTITLPTAADNVLRQLRIIKTDSGAGEIIVDGEGAETIEGFQTIHLIKQHDYIALLCDGSKWLRIGGPIAPVAGEHSWGTPHPHIEELVNTDPTDTNDHVVTVSNVPTGTKGIAGYFIVGSITTAGRFAQIKDIDANAYAMIRNPSTSINGYSWFEVPLDSNKQFKWAVNHADVNVIIINMKLYYL